MTAETGGPLRLCGLMKTEDATHKFLKPRYFDLDLVNQQLKIYEDTPQNLPTSKEFCDVIDLNVISKVSDARKSRPKGGFCFCITHSGEQYFIQAESELEMNRWIDNLNAACKIVVHDAPHAKGKILAPPNSRNEIAGGVVITTTSNENADSGAESLEHNMPALSLPSILSGYAVKQGALRKNWKKRYFVLDTNGFSYFKHDQEKEPIRTIPLEQILVARLVGGQHHAHRPNMFEVVTSDRTYFIQCEHKNESQQWTDLINKHKDMVHDDTTNDPPLSPKSSQSLLRPSSQEATKPSKAVWEGNLLQHPDESRESRLNIRRSKKSWQLW